MGKYGIYYMCGRKTYECGATYPVRYAYDTYGNRIAMTTYRDESGTGDTTTWTYDEASGLLTAKTYADGRGPTYTYTADGKLATRTWARGVVTTYAYDGWGNLTAVTYSDGTPSVTYTYDAMGRQTSATDAAGTTTFAYDDYGDYPNGARTEYTYEPSRDLLTNVRNAKGGTVYSNYAYANDALGRRTSKNSEQYGYNVRSELTAASGNGNYAYLYDDIGNRVTSTECGTNATYLANCLNQYTNVEYSTVQPSTSNLQPSYDLDGNQTLVRTKTGIWSVTYNGENRPVSWQCGATNITMKFDRMGRRVELVETVADPIEATVATNKHQRFVYDGYLCVQRLNGANNAITDLFEWDPTEPVATKPLYWQQRTAEGNYSFFYTHDGNKNVSEVVSYQSASGIAAHYEYAPFGAVTAATGSRASSNPWCFSSEYADDTLGLVYYNYRHYEPMTGRWMARDMVGEVGGINNYLLLENRPVTQTDIFGNSPVIIPDAFHIISIIACYDYVMESADDECECERPGEDGYKHCVVACRFYECVAKSIGDNAANILTEAGIYLWEIVSGWKEDAARDIKSGECGLQAAISGVECKTACKGQGKNY